MEGYPKYLAIILQFKTNVTQIWRKYVYTSEPEDSANYLLNVFFLILADIKQNKKKI